MPALAALIGCDARALADTLRSVARDARDVHGRRFTRALSAPYHAVKVTGALFHTQGGSTSTPLPRAAGGRRPVPESAGGGRQARGVSGNDVAGYLSGNGLLSAIAGGHIAAATAAGIAGTALADEPTP